MKKLLLALFIMVGVGQSLQSAVDSDALTIYGFAPTARLGLIKTALVSAGALYALSYFGDERVDRCIKRFCAGLLAKEVVLAVTDSELIGKSIKDVPGIGQWLQRSFFTCSEEEKGILASLIGALTAIMVPIVR